MDLKEQRENFNKRFDITSSNSNPKKAFQSLRQRILNIFETIECLYREHDVASGITCEQIEPGIDKSITKESIFKFRQYYGISQSEVTERMIIDQLNRETNEKEFYRLIEVILSLKYKTSHIIHYVDNMCPDETENLMNSKEKLPLIEKVKEAFVLSDVNVTVVQSKNDIILYPKGEKILDEELINKTFSFLDKESNKDFEKALKFYARKNFRESANNLQSSLENYLRYILKNTKGIKENINTVQRNLKENKSPSEIRNIVATIFNYLNKYFDNNSKHWDKVTEQENEFLIYQTGLLLRYIDRAALKQPNETNNKTEENTE